MSQRDATTDVHADASAPAIRAHLLGSVRLTIGDRELTDADWPRQGARALFLLLLATPGHRLTRTRIVDLLWPEAAPEGGANSLRVALHALRRVLEPGLRSGAESTYVETGPTAVGLRAEAGAWIDVAAFEGAYARALAAPDVDQRAALCEAVSLYGGDLLPDEPGADWAIPRRQQLQHTWRDAVLKLARIDQRSGSPGAVSALKRLLESDPTDDAACRALIRSLASAGHRDQALNLFRRYATAVRTELKTEPDPETVALADAIRAAVQENDAPPAPARAPRFDNLPVPPTSLIGRARELEMLEDLLLDEDVRLVTITGPGGMGKTRLALEVARKAAGEFADGVCFIDVAAVRDPLLVLPTIARTLGIDQVPGRKVGDLLAQAMRGRSLLLVLDNLEQVISAADEIGSLLATCPTLTILATSREPLRLRAEHVVPTPPLAVPPLSSRSGKDRPGTIVVERYGAVALFAQRARSLRPDFAITDEHAWSVAAICDRLDGIPLAIELAAAQSRFLTPQDVLARLARRLPVLTGGARDYPERQRTLRAAIGWSYDLLQPAEQEAFRRLSVFAGEFDLEAAEVICGGSPDRATSVESGLWALVDKSLVVREDGGGPDPARYRLLGTIQEFGLEQLSESGEEDLVRRRHAAYFQRLAGTAAPHFRTASHDSWADQLEANLDNIRAALDWACEQGNAETALGIGGALWEFWRLRGYLGEGRLWLDRSLQLADPGTTPVRALAQQGAGALAHAQGDSDQAVTLLTGALDDWRSLGDQRRIGETLGLLAGIAAARGDYRGGIEFNEQALEHFEAIDDRSGIADTLNQLGLIATDRGEYAKALAMYERSSALYDAMADRNGSARVLNNLGVLNFWQEDYRGATAKFEASLALMQALGDRPHTAVALSNLGEALRADGDLDAAMAVARQGLALSREVGDRRSQALSLFIIGSLIQHNGPDQRAIEPLREGLALYHLVGDRMGMAWCLEALAGPATTAGHPNEAAQLLGAAEALREDVGVSLQPAELPAYQRHLDAARQAIPDPGTFDEAWRTGRTLPLDAVVDLAARLPSEAS